MKKFSFLSNQKKPSDAMEAEIDLDTSPIMNVLIILIPFLASVAVYTHLSVINLSLPPNVGAGMAGSHEKPRLKLTVVVAENYLALTHGEKLLDSIPNLSTGMDYEKLKERLLSRRTDIDIRDEVVVAVNDPIQFKFVVNVMDICRDHGFSKVGLAAGPGSAPKGR